jgi:hypothetical protein
VLFLFCVKSVNLKGIGKSVFKKENLQKANQSHNIGKKKERRGGKKGKCAAFFTGQKGTKKIKQKRNNNFDQ